MGNIAVAHMTLSSYSRKRASQDVERRLHQAVPHWVHKGGVFSAGCAAPQFEDSICPQLEQRPANEREKNIEGALVLHS